MASTHNGSPGNCLLLRLSCWYQSNVGESTKQNTKLYRSFSEKELEPAWVLAAVTPSERNDQTKIVAISVEFRHRSVTSSHKEAEQRGQNLWNGIILPTIDVFSKAENISPVAVVLYALNDDLAPALRAKLCHYKINEDGECKIQARVRAPPAPPAGWRYSIKALLGFGEQGVETATHMIRQFWGGDQKLKDSDIPREPQPHGPCHRAGTATQQRAGAQSGWGQSGQSGQGKSKQALNIDIEGTKAAVNSIFKFGSVVNALAEENEAHHRALTNDINTNHQRLGNPMVVFESTMNDILAGLKSIILTKDSNPQQTGPPANVEMNDDIDADALHTTSQAMKDMLKVQSIVEENLENLLAAIERKYDSEIQPWQYVSGGIVLAAYAGGCYFFPGLAIYAWVTGSLATSAVAVGGVAGAGSTTYGAWKSKGSEKAKERRENVTDNFNHLTRALHRYFAVVAVYYYEKVFHIPFRELNEIKKRQCLNAFGVDADQVHDQNYLDAQIEKGAEVLELARDRFNESLKVLSQEEGLPPIQRSYV